MIGKVSDLSMFKCQYSTQRHTVEAVMSHDITSHDIMEYDIIDVLTYQPEIPQDIT